MKNDYHDSSKWADNPSLAWKFAMEEINHVAETGQHGAVGNLVKAANNYKGTHCTNGLWRPGSELVYDILSLAADVAQEEYENQSPPDEG